MGTDLIGRTALVTGAARGIGLAIAAALVERGANVTLVDVDDQALETACGALPRTRVLAYRGGREQRRPRESGYPDGGRSFRRPRYPGKQRRHLSADALCGDH